MTNDIPNTDWPADVYTPFAPPSVPLLPATCPVRPAPRIPLAQRQVLQAMWNQDGKASPGWFERPTMQNHPAVHLLKAGYVRPPNRDERVRGEWTYRITPAGLAALR